MILSVYITVSKYYHNLELVHVLVLLLGTVPSKTSYFGYHTVYAFDLDLSAFYYENFHLSEHSTTFVIQQARVVL